LSVLVVTVICLGLAAAGLSVVVERERQLREVADQHAAAVRTSFRQTRDTVEEYLTWVSEERLLNRPGFQPLRRDLLQAALEYHKKFVADHGEDPTVRADLGRSYRRLASLTALVGSLDEAVKLSREGLAAIEQLTAEAPDDADLASERAEAERELGRLLNRARQPAEAERHIRSAIEAMDALLKRDPGRREWRAARATAQHDPGTLFGRQDRVVEAQASFEAACVERERLHHAAPQDLLVAGRLAETWHNLGLLAS
jgi:tetratricopeptide (TPR) repeat protein